MPQSLDELCEADVVGIELVDANQGANSGSAQAPFDNVANHWEFARVQVVEVALCKAHMRMQDEHASQNAVEDGVRRYSKRSSDNGHEGSGSQALKSPVEGAVRL